MGLQRQKSQGRIESRKPSVLDAPSAADVPMMWATHVLYLQLPFGIGLTDRVTDVTEGKAGGA